MSNHASASRKECEADIQGSLTEVTVVIPAYNEAGSIGQVIRSLREAGLFRIVMVDDGSYDETKIVAKREGVLVISHCVNVGLGGALSTGVTAALAMGAAVIVTCDADGQHDAQDVVRVVEPVLRGECAIAIGSRQVNRQSMPLGRRFVNLLANIVTVALYGIWCSDTQSGLRAFSHDAAVRFPLTAIGMEVSSEIIGQIKRHSLVWCEVPIKAIYTRYSLSKGQRLSNWAHILMSLFLNWRRGLR